MVSHCIILMLGHFTHYTHGTFYCLWALVAGASAARIVSTGFDLKSSFVSSFAAFCYVMTHLLMTVANDVAFCNMQ